MTEDQIKLMVNRFLGWTLPDNFNPDGGVSFKRPENRHHHSEASPFYPMPTGTNLLDAQQATEMVRHMIADLPDQPQTAEVTDAMVSAGLDGWFSVKPTSAESDAVLERSMRAALTAALAMSRPKLCGDGQ